MIGTHEFEYTNYMLMEPDESTHLTTDNRTIAGVCRSIMAQPNKLLHKTHTREMMTQRRWNDNVVGGSEELQ